MAWDGDGRWYWFKDQNAKPWTTQRNARFGDGEQRGGSERGHRRAATKADIQLGPVKQEHGYLKMKGFVHELGYGRR